MKSDAEKRSRLAGLLIVLAVAIGPSVILTTFGLIGFHSTYTGRGGAAVAYMVNFILHEIISLLLLVYVLSCQKRDLASIGVDPQLSDIPWSLLLVIGMSACYILALALVNVIWPGPHGTTPESLLTMASAPAALLTAAIAINPIFEELIVRGYAATELIALIGNRWVAAGLTVIVQGYYHIYQGVHYALALTGVFAVAALYFAIKRRVIPIILAHFYLDAYGFYVLVSATHRAI